MYTGSCLCGGITFKIKGSITDPIYCHCSRCRKASGSAFATNGFINTSEFELRDIKNVLKCYESAEGNKKYFCSDCGAPIYSSNSMTPDKLRIRLGVIDSDIREHPISHNFICSKANWEQLDRQLPRYEKFEPTRK